MLCLCALVLEFVDCSWQIYALPVRDRILGQFLGPVKEQLPEARKDAFTS